MTVVRDIPDLDEPDPGSVHRAFADLVDDKAWQHLGVTGEEFRRMWYAGEFAQDTRPAAAALDRLMRTGEWQLPS